MVQLYLKNIVETINERNPICLLIGALSILNPSNGTPNPGHTLRGILVSDVVPVRIQSGKEKSLQIFRTGKI